MKPAAPRAPGAAFQKSRRWLILFALGAAIIAWQVSYNSASLESRRPFAMKASMGLCPDAFLFFYFFHHFGVFPVGAYDVPRLGRTKADAEKFVAEHGNRLKMDFGLPTNTPRFGDFGKLLLFYPDLWMNDDPAHPILTPFNQILFITALVALAWSFWAEGLGLLGTLIVVLVGSDPFQVLETYARGNVFSIPISVALLVMAAHLRFLTRRKGVDGIAWGIAILSGIVLASFREVRAEAAIMAVAVLATYLFAKAPLIRRLALAAAFLVAFAATASAWTAYWDASFARAERFVARAGGEVFHRPNGTHHAFWHAIACGLGDYGTDRGFTWDDRDAFRWATTRDAIANPNPIPYHYVDGYYFEETFDGVHHVAPTDVPAYNTLMRTRVLREIRRHPAWYAGVLYQRWLAIQRDATPASFSTGSGTYWIPGVGWLTLPVLLFALWRRRFVHASLILFFLPLSAMALLVYSGKGMTYYGIAHLVALAVLIDLLVSARWPAARTGGRHAH